MSGQGDTVERKLATMAARRHGVVTRGLLLRAGLTEDQIDHRLGRGGLIREHRGVYSVGHRARSIEARYMAAVLACGPGAALSGKAAGHLLGLLKGKPPPTEVTAPTLRRVKGVRTRRSTGVERTIWRGIPVTTVPRTLVDLAAVLDEEDLARAVHEAEVRHHLEPTLVDAVLAGRPRCPGAGTLRRVMHGEVKVTLSRLERRFLELLRRAGLPLPETNRVAGSHRVDCRWPEHNLTVELDSYRYHRSRHAWEQDRRREREAYARGDGLRRFTWGDVVERPHVVVSELRALLPAGSSPPARRRRRAAA